jgi:hypothetical protein
MLALSTFMRYKGEEPLGGVVGLLGYVPLPTKNMTGADFAFEYSSEW